MVFEFPAAAGHLKKNRFHFKLNGKDESLPKLEFVPPETEEYLAAPETANRIRREFILGFIGSIDADLEQRVRDARFARDQLEAFYDAWIASSKVGEGESSASESS